MSNDGSDVVKLERRVSELGQFREEFDTKVAATLKLQDKDVRDEIQARRHDLKQEITKVQKLAQDGI